MQTVPSDSARSETQPSVTRHPARQKPGPEAFRSAALQALPSRWAQARSRVAVAIALFFLSLAATEASWQHQDDAYVSRVTQEVVRSAHAETSLQQVVALRDYLRAQVTYHGAAYAHRPFLRETAGTTLRTGKGYCGEVTRTFICMAGSLGIPAQRINLYGRQPHVVAEVQLAPRQRVIVDCQNPPMVATLEPLDRVILQPEWDDYSTLNLRRLRLSSVFSRVKMEMGPLTYWSENPHALKAAFWSLLAVLLFVAKVSRAALRVFLRRRGWVHLSSHPGASASVVGPTPRSPSHPCSSDAAV